jgi:DNA-binding Xre family transcriptional regulator
MDWNLSFQFTIRRDNMIVNYNRLWKMLIDLDMNKSQLRENAGITTNAIAKMGKNENVSTEVICKICEVLDCQIQDIVELIKE